MTLVEFLLARIAEDEATARDCAGAPWVAQVTGMVHVDSAAIRDDKLRFGRMGYVATVEHDYDRQHIARHDPARVLRECEAKRQIVKRCDNYDGDSLIGHDVLRFLASSYTNHPDYRDEWRP